MDTATAFHMFVTLVEDLERNETVLPVNRLVIAVALADRIGQMGWDADTDKTEQLLSRLASIQFGGQLVDK